MVDVYEVFDQLMGELESPMYIVTVAAGDARSGCLVGFATQVSINPRRFLVGLSKKNHTTTVAAAATHLAVHLIRRQDRKLASLFGEETGDHTDKLAQCRWSPGPAGLPVLDDAAGWFAGRIERRVDLGDHIGYLLDPIHAEARAPRGPLFTSADARGLDAGHDA